MYKVMIVEDDEIISNSIAGYLNKWQYTTHEVSNFQNVITEFVEEKPDIVLMDINLPYFDGYYFCEEIRKISNVHIIMLTALDQEIDIVAGYDIGADDYITKPFSLIVLISKVNAFMRRIGNTIIENIIFCDKLKFDYVENKLTKDKEEILLSKNEGKLLKYLMENSSQTVTKEKLMEALWDIDGNFVDENTLAVNIRRLRQKVEDNPSEPEYIKNIRGVGYTFAKRCIKK